MEPQPVVVAPKNKVGTSLEVLQHYLTAGIEVEVIEPYGGAGMRHRLRGLDPRLQFPVLCGDYSTGAEFACFGILPVLRPFAALDKLLPDGTVPAVEVAKLVLASQYDVKHHRYEATHIRKVSCGQPGLECFEMTVPGLNDNLVVAIYNNMDLENEDREVTSADVLDVVDYLRSKHFAVGLNPDQFLPLS